MLIVFPMLLQSEVFQVMEEVQDGICKLEVPHMLGKVFYHSFHGHHPGRKVLFHQWIQSLLDWDFLCLL